MTFTILLLAAVATTIAHVAGYQFSNKQFSKELAFIFEFKFIHSHL